MDPESIERIQHLAFTADADQLYRGIAAALPSSEREQVAEAAALRPSDLVDVGRRFFEDRFLPAIEDIICGQVDYCKNRGKYDVAAHVVSLVADKTGEALGIALGIPGQVGSVGGALISECAAAVLKMGLDKLCRCTAG